MKLRIEKVKAIARDVYRSLGSGFSEDVYDKAMQVGLRLAGFNRRLDVIAAPGQLLTFESHQLMTCLAGQYSFFGKRNSRRKSPREQRRGHSQAGKPECLVSNGSIGLSKMVRPLIWVATATRTDTPLPSTFFYPSLRGIPVPSIESLLFVLKQSCRVTMPPPTPWAKRFTAVL